MTNNIISALQVGLEGEIIHTQYCIKNKRLDAYLLKYKFGMEVVEYDHKYKDANHEQSRQLVVYGYIIAVIRTNPETSNCINRLIN